MTLTYGLWTFGLLFGGLAGLVLLCIVLDAVKGSSWARRKDWI
jgi:hypothetical protein